ncbi:hypothetical protein ACJRO7_015614 [Eucalyptus globulus]|uniref:Uncharacterized protein n=1 Tax=Eucalyptus globulus TaxID=34317 RepID=A0ABD3LEJ5_EUCGL
MGDLGTYIPVVLALTLAKDLNLGTNLIFTSVYDMVTGAIYGVPMPVRPMKAITAVGISSADFGIPEVMAAGSCTGAIFVVLGVTRLMQLVYRMIPLSVVRGIQLSQGLSRFLKVETGWGWLGLDGLVLAIVCACFIVIINGTGEERRSKPESGDDIDDQSSMRKRKWKRIMTVLPSAFIIFLLGVVLAFIREPKVVRGIKFGPSSIEVAQLSIFNSVISACKLSYDLFPKDFSSASVLVTVRLMNAVRCWLGPCQAATGPRRLRGDLGATKLILGLVLESFIVKVLDQFPVGVLGVLLLFAGIELALAARDMDSKEAAFAMLICAAVSLVGLSAVLGFLCGIVVHVVLRLRNLSSIRSCSATP